MPRFKIHIQYDGSSFNGWQFQKDAVTIQGEIEKILFLLNHKQPIKLIGAGRTDSGVHALNQVAHFVWDTDKDTCKIKAALNGNLPDEIFIRECAIVPDDFHARFSAQNRKYVYKCRINEYIFDRNIVWKTGDLNLALLNKTASLFLGEHDFTSFSKANSEVKNRICNVDESQWKKQGSIVNYTIKANRFLHHMVRYLVGTMVAVENKKMSIKDFKDRLINPRENVQVYKAPPQGLFLKDIEYNGADII